MPHSTLASSIGSCDTFTNARHKNKSSSLLKLVCRLRFFSSWMAFALVCERVGAIVVILLTLDSAAVFSNFCGGSQQMTKLIPFLGSIPTLSVWNILDPYLFGFGAWNNNFYSIPLLRDCPNWKWVLGRYGKWADWPQNGKFALKSIFLQTIWFCSQVCKGLLKIYLSTYYSPLRLYRHPVIPPIRLYRHFWARTKTFLHFT